MEEREADVVVIGAGFAGLAAARALVADGIEPLVIEARDRVGGRTLNASLGEGKVVEVGGQWIGPTQERIAALAAELEVATFRTHTEGENLVRLGDRPRRYSGTIPRVGPGVLLDVGQALRRLNRLARRIDPAAPWAARDATRLDATTLGAWSARTMATRPARQMMRLAGRTIWGAEPEQLSLLHVCFYLRSAGSFELLADVEGGAQQDRLVGGSQLVAIRAAEALGDRVVLAAPARRIAYAPDRCTVEAGGAHDAAELRVRARRAIVAVPPPIVARIAFDPPLPPSRRRLAGAMAPGWLVKAIAIYDEPFWRADGLSGEALSEAGPVTTTFDNSPPDGSPGALLGFVGGRDARDFSRLGASERRLAALACFESLFGPRARRAERYIELDWGTEEWSGGGPTCNFPTGGWTEWGPLLREPLGPVHWAGTETATRWAGYIDGAVSSGERAAAEVAAAL